ncbi:MAG: hypothetical protein K8R23_12120 [Chthoniobacter sp.]|nr:hypothetical protein [Chthoniobacter sp.]
MKLHQLITVTATFALVTSLARGNELPKGARADIKAAVKEQNGPGVPPELRTPRVDARTEKMRLLIVQGIKEGTLTVGEATSLECELARIEREEKTYKQNGRAGHRERRDLKRDINELHERIWKKTHNGVQPAQPLEK